MERESISSIQTPPPKKNLQKIEWQIIQYARIIITKTKQQEKKNQSSPTGKESVALLGIFKVDLMVGNIKWCAGKCFISSSFREKALNLQHLQIPWWSFPPQRLILSYPSDITKWDEEIHNSNPLYSISDTTDVNNLGSINYSKMLWNN